MIKSIFKNIIMVLVLLLSLVLIGCETKEPQNTEEPEKPENPNITVEYDELLYYSQVGKIEVKSVYEDDDFYIESLNTKVIKIIENNGDNLIAKAVGLGEAEIHISNAYGDELTITIKVEAKEGFAPPIENMELSFVEEGPYYVNTKYHLQVKFAPEIYNDTYRFITSEDYELNPENLEVVFKRSGKMIISIFAETNSKRTNLEVNVQVNTDEEMYEVLFIGNSLTYVHDIPSIIQNMITSDGSYMVILKIHLVDHI